MLCRRSIMPLLPERPASTILQALFMLSFIQVLTCQSLLYVSSRGRDTSTCGQFSPCLSLNHAIQLAPPRCVIKIDGSDPSYLYKLCGDVDTQQISSLKLAGFNGKPKLGCLEHSRHNKLLDYRDMGEKRFLAFENVHLQNGGVTLDNVALHAANTTLLNTAITSQPNCSFVSVTLHSSSVERGSTWDGNESPVGSHGFVNTYIRCANVSLVIRNSTIQDVNLQLDISDYGDVFLTDTLFTKKLSLETGIGGINVTLPHQHGQIIVHNCIFEKLIHFEPVYSAINIESAALRIESQRVPLNVTHALVRITDSVFRYNERALSISRSFKHIEIQDCLFHDNRVMHAGAALRIAVQDNITAYIENCTFFNNEAGYNRHQTVPGAFEFDGDQVRIHSKQINGIISLVGKGGAVRVHRAKTIFTGCLFSNNSARLLGGSIFVDYKAAILLENTHFINSDAHKLSMQGDILYSSGHVSMINTSFDVRTASNHVSVIRHGGTHWSMEVSQIQFKCPLGHSLNMVNTTSHRIKEGTGIYRSHRLDQLYYYCQTCGNNEYSVDRGSIDYEVIGNSSEYPTLVINGRKLLNNHPVYFKYGNITCRECPYGADCSGSIRAVANFWGYISKNEAIFQHCPPGYCCSSTTCPSINACAGERGGPLCGRCNPGYSEALFSTRCLPNAACGGARWVIPLTLTMGLIYALFLMFQSDFKESVSELAFDWSSVNFYQAPEARRPRKNIDEGDKSLFKEESTTLVSNGRPREELDVDQEETETDISNQAKVEGGCMIILFYYFQDALLLNINTIYTRTVSELQRRLKAFLVGLFRFRLDIYQFMDDVCVYPNMQPTSTLFFKSLFVPYVLLLFGFMYVIFRGYRCLKKVSSRNDNQGKPFACRLAAGCVLAFLFTYQKLATATFTLLNCVPLANTTVLYIDGSKVCFDKWQYIVMAYAFACVIPFSFILMLGPFLLKGRYISLGGFFIGCLFPLPSIAVWISMYITNKVSDSPLSRETETVIQILQGPFKDSNSKNIFRQLCWAGVLVGRRLILFLCYTFINDVLVRLLSMMIVCFVILMHHMYVRPYKTTKGNMAGALSAAALLIVGAINLLRASFEAAEYVPQGPYKLLMIVCEEVENTLVLWLPLACVSVVLLVILVKLPVLFLQYVLRRKSHNDVVEVIDMKNRRGNCGNSV